MEQEKCTAHSGIEAKLSNVEQALMQVMEELRTRKLTPGAVWIIGAMSTSMGAMGMWIITH